MAVRRRLVATLGLLFSCVFSISESIEGNVESSKIDPTLTYALLAMKNVYDDFAPPAASELTMLGQVIVANHIIDAVVSKRNIGLAYNGAAFVKVYKAEETGQCFVGYRGTKRLFDWIQNLRLTALKQDRNKLVAEDPVPDGLSEKYLSYIHKFQDEHREATVKPHNGFYKHFSISKAQVMKRLDEYGCTPDITVAVGHSLGGATASLAGTFGLADSVITIGAPRTYISYCPTTHTRLKRSERYVMANEVIKMSTSSKKKSKIYYDIVPMIVSSGLGFDHCAEESIQMVDTETNNEKQHKYSLATLAKNAPHMSDVMKVTKVLGHFLKGKKLHSKARYLAFFCRTKKVYYQKLCAWDLDVLDKLTTGSCKATEKKFLGKTCKKNEHCVSDTEDPCSGKCMCAAKKLGNKCKCVAPGRIEEEMAEHEFKNFIKAVKKNDVKTVQRMLRDEAHLNLIIRKTIRWKTPLHVAAAYSHGTNGRREYVAQLASNIHRISDRFKKTVFGKEDREQSIPPEEMAQTLLEAKGGMDILNEPDETGATPAIEAAKRGNPAVLNILLEKGANIFVRSSHGETMLYWTAMLGDYYKCASIILNAQGGKTLLDERGQWGWTPLMVAARYHRTKTLEVLLQHGADVHVRDATGKSALDLAQAYKWSYPRSADKTVKLLKDAGASPKVAPGKCKKKRWSLSTCSKNSECVSSKSNPCTGTCMCDTSGINLCTCLTVVAATEGNDPAPHPSLPAPKIGPPYLLWKNWRKWSATMLARATRALDSTSQA
jgi:hypothetical protein